MLIMHLEMVYLFLNCYRKVNFKLSLFVNYRHCQNIYHELYDIDVARFMCSIFCFGINGIFNEGLKHFNDFHLGVKLVACKSYKGNLHKTFG